MTVIDIVGRVKSRIERGFTDDAKYYGLALRPEPKAKTAQRAKLRPSPPRRQRPTEPMDTVGLRVDVGNIHIQVFAQSQSNPALFSAGRSTLPQVTHPTGVRPYWWVEEEHGIK